jgi:serine/threonine protein phosphatase 1
MGRQFVIGDIHGAFRALIQCFEKCRFDQQKDTLICLGDVCDGWPETRRCIDQLLQVKNIRYVLGNHDLWLLDWMKSGSISNIWYVQGGEESILSYAGKPVPEEHLKFLKQGMPYFLSDGRLFVHAGIDSERELDEQTIDTFCWDRTLAKQAIKYANQESKRRLTNFNEVYIGHTPTSFGQPVQGCEVWLMDTGAGWSGVLSMMDIDSKEVYVSDPVPQLYPGVQGRAKKY